VAHVVGVDMAHSLGDFTARHSAVKVEHLSADLLHDVGGGLHRSELVVKSVPGADNFDIVHVVGVDCGKGDAAVVHLAREHLVAKEPVAEDSTVGVRAVKTLLSSDINKVTKHAVHTVVLFLDIIQVFGVHIDLVVTKHSLPHQKGIEVFMFPARCVVENTNTGVYHLIVSNHKQTRIKDSLLQTVSLPVGLALNIAEMLLSQVHKLLMLNCTSAYNDHVFAIVVGSVEIHNHVTVNLTNVVDVTQNWLSHHMLTVNVVVHVFHESFF
jgi:hypothetical protein